MSILNPFYISMLIFILVALNMIIEVNDKLVNLGVINDGVSRGRLIWYYVSAVYTFLIKCLIALFTIFILITVIIIIIIAIFHLIKGSDKFLESGGSREEIMKQAMIALFTTLSKYVKGNIDYVYKFVMTSKVIKMFLIMLPLFVFVIMIGFACTFYQPITTYASGTSDEEIPNGYMFTVHGYLYYLFVMFVFSMILYIIYEFFILGTH